MGICKPVNYRDSETLSPHGKALSWGSIYCYSMLADDDAFNPAPCFSQSNDNDEKRWRAALLHSESEVNPGTGSRTNWNIFTIFFCVLVPL